MDESDEDKENSVGKADDKEDDDAWVPNRSAEFRMKKKELDEKVIVLSAKKVKTGWVNGTSSRADVETVSSRKAISLVGGVLSGIGITEDDVTLSSRNFHRQRERRRLNLADSVKQSLDRTAWYALHWDGKKMNGKRNVDKSKDYVAVVLTNLLTGKETILDIPGLENGKAKETTDAIVKICEDWGILKRIVAVVFDTTSANSGCLQGIAVSLEKVIGHQLVNIYCRHHIFERIGGAIADTLFPSTCPKNAEFKPLLQGWGSLDLGLLDLLDLPPNRSVRSIVSDFVLWAKEVVVIKDFLRNDYYEMVALPLLLLGEFPAEIKFTIHAPGSISSARWMQRFICSMKVVLFSTQLVRNKIMTSEDIAAHKQLVLFLIMFYIRQWTEAPLVSLAATNDLSLFKSLM